MSGEFLLTILSSIAQQESESISGNVKLGLKMKMERGELVGFNRCLGYNYDSFETIGAFSTASFLFKDDFYKFLDKNIDKQRKVFLYVGKAEESDDIFDQDIYLNSSIELLHYFENHNTKARLVISAKGIHNEECWDKAFSDFISYIYEENIIYRY